MDKLNMDIESTLPLPPIDENKEERFSEKINRKLGMRRSSLNSQNSSMSFFNETRRRSSSCKYSQAKMSEWLNNNDIQPVTISDTITFYFNSLYNNKLYKFMFVQYMGELTMMYEHSVELLKRLLEIEKEESIIENDRNKNFLYFLDEKEDDIIRCFRRVDVFLKHHIHFMKLCSAPIDLFLENYYSARTNSCGLVSLIYTPDVNTCTSTKNEEHTFYIMYNDCKDEAQKQDVYQELESQYFEGSTRLYTTQRRIAALHNIIGELNALSEFIKTTVDMNDQLLFRLLMLFGSFLMLLGEFVWNTRLKQYYYD